MTKIKIFLFNLLYFVVFFFIFLCQINASDLSFSDFTTYHLINIPKWSEIGQIQPEIIFEDSIFKMWYASLTENRSKIAYAISQNGIEWQNHSLITLPTDFDNKNTHNPSILKINNNYFLFFSSSSFYWDDFKIYKIISNDGFNFNQESLKLVLIPNANNWEKNAVSDPFIFFKNNVYYLFYSAAGDTTWQIGLAYSIDGENWIRCQNNPIIKSSYGPIGGPFLLEKNQKLYLFFHSNLGIEKIESLDNLSCNSNWINHEIIIRRGTTPYDTNHIISPSLIEKNNQLFLFYSGLNNSGWSLNLIIFKQPNSTNSPIILLPGLFASWNKEAILHNQQVEIFDWKLLPFVKEYDGIINTLKNLGYQENQDFFIFPYDWRKSVDQSSEDLKTFINEKISEDKKVNLIGHSLGGLVARIFTQKYKEKVNKLITVGSPHQGASQSYKAVEGGELENKNTWQWLGQKLLLQVYKDGIKTDKQIINEKLPVIKDLLPTYNFLKNIYGETINVNNMTIKNNTLLKYNSNINEIFSFLSTITGESDNQTIFGYKVGPRTIFDQILDYYPDGRPIDTTYDIGDGTVISLSSKIGENKEIFNLNHGEIIYKKPAIKKILDILNLNYQEEQIIESEETKVTPSLIISLLSPATMSAILNQSRFNEYEGLIFIENAQNGDYQLNVTGTNEGKYKIIVGQITEKGDYWESIENKTTAIKNDSYFINFNQEYPSEFFIDGQNIEKLKQNIINELILINEPKNSYINLAIKKLENLKKVDEIFIIHNLLFNAIKKNNQEKWNNIFLIINKLENLYSLLAKKSISKQTLLNLELRLTDYKIKLIETNLIKKKNKEKLSNQQQFIYQLAKEKFEKANKANLENNYSLTEILLKTTNELLFLINKI